MKRTFPCPLCNSDLRASENLGGRQIRCSFCGGTIYVPNFGPSEGGTSDAVPSEEEAAAKKTPDTAQKSDAPGNASENLTAENEALREQLADQREMEEARALLSGPWIGGIDGSDAEFESTVLSEPDGADKIELGADEISRLIIKQSLKKVEAAKKSLAEKETRSENEADDLPQKPDDEKIDTKTSLLDKARKAINKAGVFGTARRKFNCPLCGTEHKATESQSGRSFRCSQCGGTIHVPHFEPAPETEAESPFALKVEPQPLDAVPDLSAAAPVADEMERRILEKERKKLEAARRSLEKAASTPQAETPSEPAAGKKSSLLGQTKKAFGLGPASKREFHCPLCSSRLRAPESQSGRQIRCSYCGGAIYVPNFAPEGETPAVSLPAEEPATPTLSSLPSLLDSLSDTALDEKPVSDSSALTGGMPLSVGPAAVEEDEISRRIAARDRKKVATAQKSLSEPAGSLAERDFSGVSAGQVDLTRAIPAHLEASASGKKAEDAETIERRYIRLRNVFIVTYVGMYCFGAIFYVMYYAVEFGLSTGLLWSMIATLLGLVLFNLIILVQLAWHVHGLIGLVLALGTRMVPFLNGVTAFYFCFRIGEEKKTPFDGVQKTI